MLVVSSWVKTMFNKIYRRLIRKYYQKLRILNSKILSSNYNVVGNPKISQPVLFLGLGKIQFAEGVFLGYYPSPFFYDGSIYIEARVKGSNVSVGKNTHINNGARIICDKTYIIIGDNVLIGTSFEVLDSDFHGIHPSKRMDMNYKCLPVIIENNVFIGNNVTILKGVKIGKNSVIANSSVVVKDIPADSIAAGNPARVIKSVYE